MELLIDRVLVANGEVEIRYALPTHPRSETTRFCHLRKDYFDDIIQIFAWPEETRLGEHSLLLKGPEGRWIGRVFVHGDHTRSKRM